MSIGSIAPPSVWHTGMLVAGIAGAASLQPSISPRSTLQQGIITGASLAGGLFAGTLVSKLGSVASRHLPGGPIAAFAGMAGLGLAAQAWSNHGDGVPGKGVGAIGSAGTVTATVGAAGLGVMAGHLLNGTIATRTPALVAAHPHVAGAAGALVGAAAVLALTWHMRSTPVDLGTPTRTIDAARRARRAIDEHSISGDVPPILATESGAPGSLIDQSQLGKYGTRFVHEIVSGADIRNVMGTGIDPIRVYAPLDIGAAPEERVDLAMRELERLGAFDGSRDRILVATPSGTGYIDPPSVQAEEYMSRGRIATVGLQYANKPSIKATGSVPIGADETRLMLQRLNDRIAQMPASDRPAIELFGESLGAWAQQQQFVGQGTQGIVNAGVDRALWVGAPQQSDFDAEALSQLGTTDNPGLMRGFDRIEDVDALTDSQRSALRYVSLAHDGDPVHVLDTKSIWYQRPSWLPANAHRPAGVPQEERFTPFVSGLQSVVDLFNGTRPTPGVFDAHAHDYRADLPEFVRVAFGHDAAGDKGSYVTDSQVAAITGELVRRELERSRMLEQHPGM